MHWTTSAHTESMPKPVITFVFKVLRNGGPSNAFQPDALDWLEPQQEEAS